MGGEGGFFLQCKEMGMQGWEYTFWIFQEIALFCERNSDSLLERANCFRHSLKKSVRVKSDGSDWLLGIKRGKAVTNYPKHGEKMNFLSGLPFF